MTLFDDVDLDAPRPVTLVRLAALISRAASEIGRITVEGEVHRPSTGAGRQWFTLKDRAAQVSVSVPAGRRSRCRVVAGERVSVAGRLEWVPAWGQLQLVAEEVVPVGEGAIAAMIAEARRRLAADGLVDRPRRPIPVLPTVVGVVCGREAAVRADIESVVAARFPGFPVVFIETTVSGPGAPDNIIAAVRTFDDRDEVDVIVLARGGGDATQLLPFSDEDLCRAVCALRTPVVSAIGHEGDRPLIDEVVDLRCGTPSLAAAAVIPSRADLEQRLDDLLGAATVIVARRVGDAQLAVGRVDAAASARLGVERAAMRVQRAADQLVLVHPLRELERAAARLDRVAWRGPAAARVVAAARTLGAARDQIEALSPIRVLERGYAVVRRADDRTVVRAPVDPGTDVDVQVASGTMRATVTR